MVQLPCLKYNSLFYSTNIYLSIYYSCIPWPSGNTYGFSANLQSIQKSQFLQLMSLREKLNKCFIKLFKNLRRHFIVASLEVIKF